MLTQFCSQRPAWKGAGPTLGQDIVDSSTRSVGGLTLTQGLSGSSQAGSIDLPCSVSDQHVSATGAPGLCCPYIFVYIY